MLTLCLAVTLFGCSKTEEVKKTEIAPIAFLKNLPADTTSFVALRTEQLQSEVKPSTAGDSAVAKKADALSSLSRLQKFFLKGSDQLLDTSNVSVSNISFAIAGIASDAAGTTPRVFIALQTKPNANAQLLQNIIDGLKQNEFLPVSNTDDAKVTGDISNRIGAIVQYSKKSDTTASPIYVGTGDTAIVLGSAKNDVSRILSTDPKDQNFDVINTLSKKYPDQNFLGTAPQQIAVGFFASADVFAALQSGSNQSSVDLGDLPSFPVGDIIMNHTKSGEKSKTSLLVNLQPKNDQQKLLFQRLKSATTEPAQLFNSLPAAFALDLDGGLLRTLAAGAMNPDNDSANHKQAVNPLGIVQTIKGAEIGGLSRAENGLFPDFYVLLQSEKLPELTALIKENIQDQVSTAVPMSHWLEKESEGVHMDYITSPLGVGLYIAANSSNLILTSSEAALKKLYKLTASKPANENASNATQSHDLITATVQCNDLGKIAEDLQSSFSVFTGGEQYLSNEDIVNLKSMGTIVTRVSMPSETTAVLEVER